MGVLFQSNYCSILGMYGFFAKTTMIKLLKNNLISFLGSDVHKEESIYPKITKSIGKIKKIIPNEYLLDITTNNARKNLAR